MKKRTMWSLLILALIAIALIITMFVRKNYLVKRSDTYTLYIGGYGDAAFKYSFNTITHEFSKQGEFKIKNPSFLTLSGDSRYLYSVSENGKRSSVASFLTSNGELLSEAKGSGNGPCYLSLYKGCPQSFPASGSFPMSWLFASGSQSLGASASASASVLVINNQD